MNIAVLPICISQTPPDSLGMLWSDGYSHADDILHLKASLSRILEGSWQLPGGCMPFTVHLIYLYVLASFTSLIFSVTPVTPCAPLPLPPTWMPPTFPPSAAIVISLPSTGPLIRLGWHVPRLYLTRRKLNPEPIYGASPQCPFPPCSPSLWPLHLFTSSSSSSVPCCSPSLLQNRVISLPLSARMNPHLAPPSLSVLLLPLSVRLDSALTHPPSLLSSSLTQHDQ